MDRRAAAEKALEEINECAETFIDAAHYGPSTKVFDVARDELWASVRAALAKLGGRA